MTELDEILIDEAWIEYHLHEAVQICRDSYHVEEDPNMEGQARMFMVRNLILSMGGDPGTLGE